MHRADGAVNCRSRGSPLASADNRGGLLSSLAKRDLGTGTRDASIETTAAGHAAEQQTSTMNEALPPAQLELYGGIESKRPWVSGLVREAFDPQEVQPW